MPHPRKGILVGEAKTGEILIGFNGGIPSGNCGPLIEADVSVGGSTVCVGIYKEADGPVDSGT